MQSERDANWPKPVLQGQCVIGLACSIFDMLIPTYQQLITKECRPFSIKLVFAPVWLPWQRWKSCDCIFITMVSQITEIWQIVSFFIIKWSTMTSWILLFSIFMLTLSKTIFSFFVGNFNFRASYLENGLADCGNTCIFLKYFISSFEWNQLVCCMQFPFKSTTVFREGSPTNCNV